jgi:hypothetical protein
MITGLVSVTKECSACGCSSRFQAIGSDVCTPVYRCRFCGAMYRNKEVVLPYYIPPRKTYWQTVSIEFSNTGSCKLMLNVQTRPGTLDSPDEVVVFAREIPKFTGRKPLSSP